MPNDKGKIVEITVVENKTVNRPDDSVGVEEKECTLKDIFNFMMKQFDELNAKLDKEDEKWRLKTDHLEAVSYTHLDVYKRQV